MRRTLPFVLPFALVAAFTIACSGTVTPAIDGGDAAPDVRLDAINDGPALDVRVDAIVDVPAPDVAPIPCGDAGVCGPGTICIRGRCAGCCDVPPECVPIPRGCSGALSCGCFAADPCGGCTRCQAVEADGIHCGDCMCACAAPWTSIDTPTGPRPISELSVGDLVYSMDRGLRTAVPIARVHRTPVFRHLVVRATFDTGAVFEITGRHPTADGRFLDMLRPGDALGGARVVSVATVPYTEPFTYDILPASDSGAYFAEGVLIGSTLR